MNLPKQTPSMLALSTATILIVASSLLEMVAPTGHSFVGYRLLRSAIEIITILIYPSLVLALITTKIAKRPWNIFEFATIAIAIGLVGIPALLIVETSLTNSLFTTTPYINTIIIAIGAFFWFPQTKKPIPMPRINRELALTIGIATAIYSAVIGLIATAYATLPDPDPYDWIRFYQNFLLAPPTFLVGNRPLFYWFIWLFHQGAHVDLFALFKYGLPSLTILLLPAFALLAQLFKARSLKVAVLLLPLASSSMVLYLQTAIPQTITLILMWYALTWLTYAHIKQDKFFFYGAGLLLFGGFFYHESSALFLLPWLTILCLNQGKFFINWLKHNPIPAILGILLVASNLKLINSLTIFTNYWVTRVYTSLLNGPNIFFPAQYINVDGNSVGWFGLSGVSKYYAYYVGPLILVSLVIWLIALLKHRSWVTRGWRQLVASLPAQVSGLTFLMALVITELFPRAINLALLPERVWLLGVITCSFFIVISLHAQPKLQPQAGLAMVCLLAVSIGGAIYVNNLKKNVVPSYQLSSATWIVDHLPANRIVLSSAYSYLLTYYGQSRIIGTPASTYCLPINQTSQDAVKTILEKVASQPDIQAALVTNYKADLNRYFANISTGDLQIPDDIRGLIAQQRMLKNNLSQESLKLYNIYLYYAQDNPNDPFNQRPYIQQRRQGTCLKPNLSDFPDHFKELYNDNGHAIIWQVL